MQVPFLMVVPAVVGASPPWAMRSSSAVGVRMLCLRRASLTRLVFIDLSLFTGRGGCAPHSRVGASAARNVTVFSSGLWAVAAWDDRRMEWKDDPEDRIRELESQLTPEASASEPGAAAAPLTPPATSGASFAPKAGFRLWGLTVSVIATTLVVAGCSSNKSATSNA